MMSSSPNPSGAASPGPRRTEKTFGRPKMAAEIEESIREALQDGRRIVSTAKAHGCGVSAVQRIKSEMVAESTARPA
jgi:hypothetical protein